MQYYAHKSDSGNEKLIDHLKLTAELAASNGLSFNSSKICEQLGLIHDVGKHTVNFQKVLNHELCKQDHAIVAGIVYNSHSDEHNTHKWLREHMSLIMACHHSYLYSDNHSFAKQNFAESMYLKFDDNADIATRDDNKVFPVQNQAEYDEIKEYIRAEGLFLDISGNDGLDVYNMSENEKMFYVRMLYSCLVDADYSATSIYCNNKSKSDFENQTIDAKMCSDKLHVYYENLIANTDGTSEINKLRKYVYDICHAKGSELSGFVTLTAPTGTGKTLALMEFALEQAKKFKKDRIFVVLPFLSIIDQNSAVYKEIFGDDVVLVDNSQVEFTEATQLESERWSAPIIVTTSVKFFETLFASKATSLRRLHNVSNSVVVFDECQTFPSGLLNSTIEVLQSLTKYYNTTVLFSTATKPNYEYRNRTEIRQRGFIRKEDVTVSSMMWNAQEIINDVQSVFDTYSKIKNTDVHCDISEKNYSCADLVDYYDDVDRVVYIFNTVKHATEMYEELCSRYDPEDCYLITGNFCAVDKLAIISEINYKLKKHKKVKLAATQCIEAGVDFDFDAGAREYAPLESIIQSAGRVCRNGGRQGRFLVFTYYRHGQYDYPSSGYRHASGISFNLAKKNNGLSFYDISQMREYYCRLYQAEAYKSDIPELYDGEFNDNYKLVSDNYKLIENKNQAIVIVRPFYHYDESEFNALIDDIIMHGYTITKGLMKKLSAYTVSTYISPKSDIDAIGTQLRFRGYMDAKLNWFLLRDDANYSHTGLSIKSDGGIFL